MVWKPLKRKNATHYLCSGVDAKNGVLIARVLYYFPNNQLLPLIFFYLF